jgi:hypothetical protein
VASVQAGAHSLAAGDRRRRSTPSLESIPQLQDGRRESHPAGRVCLGHGASGCPRSISGASPNTPCRSPGNVLSTVTRKKLPPGSSSTSLSECDSVAPHGGCILGQQWNGRRRVSDERRTGGLPRPEPADAAGAEDEGFVGEGSPVETV